MEAPLLTKRRHTMNSQIDSMRRTIYPMRRTHLPNIAKYEEDLYAEVHKMLVEAALDACSNSGLPFEELRAQADLLFVMALRRFDDERGVKFSTFLWTVVHNGLVDYGKNLRKHDDWRSRVSGYANEDGEVENPIDTAADPTSDRYFGLMDDLNHMSRDAQQLADIVLSGFCSDLTQLRRLATDRLGFSLDQYQEAVYDLRQMVICWG